MGPGGRGGIKSWGLYKIYNRKVRVSPSQRLQRLPARYSKQKLYTGKCAMDNGKRHPPVFILKQFILLPWLYWYCSCVVMPTWIYKQDAINSAKKRDLGKRGGGGGCLSNIFFRHLTCCTQAKTISHSLMLRIWSKCPSEKEHQQN